MHPYAEFNIEIKTVRAAPRSAGIMGNFIPGLNIRAIFCVSKNVIIFILYWSHDRTILHHPCLKTPDITECGHDPKFSSHKEVCKPDFNLSRSQKCLWAALLVGTEKVCCFTVICPEKSCSTVLCGGETVRNTEWRKKPVFIQKDCNKCKVFVLPRMKF